MSVRFLKFALLFFVGMSTFLCGCGTWRAVPTHGGGKRFDEEQRVVAGSIRTAVSQINLDKLKEKKVTIVMTSLCHDGGGQWYSPGLNSLSLNYNDADQSFYNGINGDYIRESTGGGISYSFKSNLRPTVFRTNIDLQYLESSLLMKMHMNGINVVPKASDVTLYILVDILGTNHSIDDKVIVWSDKLKGTCEITYYAVENETRNILFGPKSVCGSALYTQHNSLIYLNNYHEFSMGPKVPTGFANGEDISYVNIRNGGLIPFKSDVPQEVYTIKDQLQMANSYISAKDFSAAQKIVNDILRIAPDYPGLDAVMSRLKSEQSGPEDESGI